MSAIPTATARSSDSSDAKNKTIILAAVCLAGLMMPLSFTGPAVATPAIARELHGSPIALAWVVNAFVLAFGSCVMAAGTLADQLGRKRIFRAGVVGFTLLSLITALAPNLLLLDLLRGAQGVAAALAMAGGAASLAQEFEGAARTRAFSLLGTTFGVGLAFGPIWSGFLIEALGWRAIFFTGALIGMLVLVFGLPRMHETRDPHARGIDWWGTLSFTAALSLLIFGITLAPQSGWASVPVLALLLSAAALLLAFIWIELHQERPMLELSLFLYPRFIGVQLLPLATAVCFVVLLIVLPIGFIGVEGYSEIQAGMMMIPLSAPMAIVPFVAGVLARHVSSGLLSALGLVTAALGLLWLAAIPLGQQSMAVIWPMLLIGVGTGLPWGLMDDLSISVVPKERAGMATGIFSTMRLAGEAIALAAVGATLMALMQSGLRQQGALADTTIAAIANDMAAGDFSHATTLAPQADLAMLTAVYADAFHTTLYVLAGLTIVAALISFAMLRAPHNTANRKLPAPCEAAEL
ncbi:MFS transporter [Collimonas sp.]|jgi:MFS family permease|uniref:MFS transporter n=1 Tax=Collimonas sp. TaxID=1963772 RepID=UPI002C1F7721|nr:MFS transporter [Collimonas sp.]HWW04573.1 MFS transporter [Collimonas sp.]